MNQPFHPLLARFIGIDRAIQAAESIARAAEGFPPHNIIKTAENDYRIELAVAGFAESEINVETLEGVLSVKGSKTAEDVDPASFLYRGIAGRSFERKFQLADSVEVVAASLRNGILSIDLRREIPEGRKYRKVDIGGVKSEPEAA